MANLGLGEVFDASSVAPAVPFQPLPPGEYLAWIVASEMKDTKVNPETGQSGKMLSLQLEILEGEYQGRRIFDNLNLINANQQTVDIARRALSSICHATGKMQVQDSDELHGIAMMVNVATVPDNREAHLPMNQRTLRNQVKGYSARQAGPAGQMQQRQAPQTPQGGGFTPAASGGQSGGFPTAGGARPAPGQARPWANKG